jgi:hypothetical protein
MYRELGKSWELSESKQCEFAARYGIEMYEVREIANASSRQTLEWLIAGGLLDRRQDELEDIMRVLGVRYLVYHARGPENLDGRDYYRD